MLRVLSYAYWAVIAITAPVFFLGALIIWLVTLPFDRRKVVLHLYSCVWAVFFVALNPLWRLDTTRRDHLPWKGPAVIVANHASLVDILVLFDLFRPFKWVSKRENFKIPFIGWNMRLNGYVPLIRGDRESIVAMLAKCSTLLERGSPVLFFPEGTRSPDGAMRQFKNGAFELSMQHGVPLIPVAVHGTSRALPKHGMVLRDHIDAHVDVLAPLDPADFGSVAELRDAARQQIADALAARDADRA
jgi:1-acyl-sn-glycerol-3-phosphate acyltransferase